MISDTPGRGGEGGSKKGKFLRTSFMDGPLAIFKRCSDSLNMGRVCSVLMPGVPRDPTKFHNDWPSKSC